MGRGRRAGPAAPDPGGHLERGGATLERGDSLVCYEGWPAPTVIVSDGAYGVLGFEGDTAGPAGLPGWYEPHVRAWAAASSQRTTLWFWNTELGWASVHPVLARHGFRYVGCNVWDKGLGHVAGNVNTGKIRHFPVVTEVCAHYVREATVGGRPLQVWLLDEWRRTGLPLRRANEACGVKDAATRKYLNQGPLWYCPPPSVMERLVRYASEHGDPAGRPYFSLDGARPLDGEAWARMRAPFRCPHGVTNVWARPAMRGAERIKLPGGRAAHLNQKPLDLMARIIEASSAPGDVLWEPFGGLFSASLAATRLGRRAFAAEVDPGYFALGAARFPADDP